ncbi:MAG: hypothetical protein KL787_07995 [Taibaiella sp.]|nr:hypothetical protein [Taibaiella sp.]
MKKDREQLKQILVNALPLVDEDIVLIYAAVEGTVNGKLQTKQYNEAFQSITIADKSWRAISWTTACSIAGVIETCRRREVEEERIYQAGRNFTFRFS